MDIREGILNVDLESFEVLDFFDDRNEASGIAGDPSRDRAQPRGSEHREVPIAVRGNPIHIWSPTCRGCHLRELPREMPEQRVPTLRSHQTVLDSFALRSEFLRRGWDS